MGDERGDDAADRRRADVYSSARIGAAAALTLAGCASGGSGASDEGAEIRVWLVGTDTPDEARQYLIDTFEEENPGSPLVIEE